MSMVTDVVFVCHYEETAQRYQELVRTNYTRFSNGYTPEPVEDSGPKVSGAIVFHNGYNYANEELLNALRREPWPDTAMLWIHGEDGREPEIRVGETLMAADGGAKDWW